MKRPLNILEALIFLIVIIVLSFYSSIYLANKLTNKEVPQEFKVDNIILRNETQK